MQHDAPRPETEPAHPRDPGPAVPGVAVAVAQGVRRVLAPNPSPMTAEGTNSYIVGNGAVAVIDPGPDDPAHLAALRRALAGARVSHILVTHAHRDHSPLAARLARETGAPVLAFGDATAGRSPRMAALAGRGMGGGEGVDHGFRPDITLADGAQVTGEGWMLQAIWTPGHFGNHMCFALDDVVFSGDHVMGWASTLVSPPDGDMGAYMRSLDRLARLRARLLLPGHGAPVHDPAARLAELVAHRRARAAAIAAALAEGPCSAEDLAQRIYLDTPQALMGAAARNVLAHLLEMVETGTAEALGDCGPQGRFRLLRGGGGATAGG